MTVQIKVFGPGCARCQMLYDNTRAAVSDLGIEAEIEKVEDAAEMAMRGIMATPALLVNGRLVLSGQVLPPRKLTELIAGAM